MIDTFQETYFTYDGISSKEFGVIIARTDNSMFSREFGLNRDIISEQTNHNPIPFNFGYTTEPLSGKITIAGRDNKLDTKRLSQIAKWLYKDDYKPLISNDNPDVVYYVKFTDQADLSLGNADEGYIALSFIANAPWGWTKPYIKTVDLRKNEGTTTVDIYNTGNYYDYNGLEIELELYNRGIPNEYSSAVDIGTDPLRKYFTIANQTRFVKFSILSDDDSPINSGRFSIQMGRVSYTIYTSCSEDIYPYFNAGYIYICEFMTPDIDEYGDPYIIGDIVWTGNADSIYSIRNTRNTKESDIFVLSDYFVGDKKIARYNLLDGEKICINMQRQTIESDNTTVPSRMINCNQKWIKLEQGKNVFEITGKGIFTFRCQYPVII